MKKIDAEHLSAEVLMYTGSESQPGMKSAAAAGMVPVEPAAMGVILYQLHFDDSYSAAVSDTLATLDEKIRVMMGGSVRFGEVLGWLSDAWRDDDAFLKSVLGNPALMDDSVAVIASFCSREITEIISAQHVRLLRAPEIIAQLAVNSSTRMAVVEKLLELAQLNGVTVPHMEGFSDSGESGMDNEAFDALIASRSGDASDSEAESVSESDDDEVSAQDAPKTLVLLLQSMNTAQKIRLAMLGNQSERSILLRDSQKVVCMAAIRSPKVQLSEVTKIAGSRNVHEDVISYIAGKAEWVRYYPVMLALTQNPKTPTGLAMGFLRQLRVNDLRDLQRSKNVPTQIARQARAVYQQKSQGGR